MNCISSNTLSSFQTFLFSLFFNFFSPLIARPLVYIKRSAGTVKLRKVGQDSTSPDRQKSTKCRLRTDMVLFFVFHFFFSSVTVVTVFFFFNFFFWEIISLTRDNQPNACPLMKLLRPLRF